MGRLLPINEISARKNYLLTQQGRLEGYSQCAHCGDTWNWKEPHQVEFLPDTAMFPCCEMCWPMLSIGKRMEYALSLLDKWNAQHRVPEFWRQCLIDCIKGGG